MRLGYDVAPVGCIHVGYLLAEHNHLLGGGCLSFVLGSSILKKIQEEVELLSSSCTIWDTEVV